MKAGIIFLILLSAVITLNAQYVEQCQPFDGTNANGQNYQGLTVAMSADGSTAAISFLNTANAESGCAIYKYTAGQWVQQSIISQVSWPYYNFDENSIALSADGSTLLFGWDSLYIYQYQGNAWNLQAKLPFHVTDEALGVSYDGNTALAGNAIYVRSGNTWSIQATLLPADSSFAFYNYNVNCSLSADGNLAAISCWYTPDSAANVWVFKRTGATWQQQGSRLEGTGSSVYSQYSHTTAQVAISGDGNTIALGNDNDSTGSNGLWVFVWQNGVWVEQYNGTLSNTFPLNFYPVASGTDNTNGCSLRLSYNGNSLIANDIMNVGFVYWKRTGNTWTNTGSLCNYSPISYDDSLGISDYLPFSLAMDSGATRVISADNNYRNNIGSAWFFTLSGSVWNQSGSLLSINGLPAANSWQGNQVVLSRDGSTLAETGAADNGMGAVWVFKRTGSTWLQMGQKLNLANWQPARFGYAISLSADGSVLAIGAPGANHNGIFYASAPGIVYIYNRNGSIYTLSDSIINHSTGYSFGSIVSLSDDGKTLLTGPNAGAGQVFTYTGSAWALQDTLLAGNTGSITGILSGDGNTAVIAQPGADNYKGYISVYYRNGNVWNLQADSLQPAGVMQDDNFPSSMAISQNGNSLFAGSSSYDGNNGAVFLYNRTGANWSFTDSIITDSVGYYSTGTALAVTGYGDTLVETHENGVFSEYAYQGGAWQLLPTFVRSLSDNNLSNIVNPGSISLSADGKYLALGTDSLRTFVLSALYDSTRSLQTATCRQSTNGKITVIMTGGTPPYHFAWANGAPDADSAINLAPGVYSVTITDASGDTLQRAYRVNAVNNLSASYNNTTYNCTAGTGSICVHTKGGSTPYTYSWQTAPVQNTDSAIGLSPGTYLYTVADANGCLFTDSATLLSSNVWGNVTGASPVCPQPGYAVVSIYGGTAPYSYTWNNGAVTATDSPLVAGTYAATVTDANGCSVTGNVALTGYCGYAISGTVFYDKNNDCVQQAGELPGIGYTMQAVGGGITAFGSTDSSGNYTISLPGTGTYTVSIAQLHECNYPLCTDSLTPIRVTIDSSITISNVNLPLVNAGVDLTMQVNSYYPYPGSTFNYTVYYGNLQDSVIPTGSITLNYDSNLVFNSATPAYTSLDSVNHIVTWNLNQIGLLYPLNSQNVAINVTLPHTVLPRTVLEMNSAILPTTGDCNIENNYLTVPIVVLGSLDPNFKMAFPQNQLVYGDTVITYTIHFQNTGTDSTHFIQVLDTLPANLNPASAVTLATSCIPYSFNITKNGILSWTFNPYMLPDSSQNQQQSQGFVTFRVSTLGTLALGTAINNRASIYFDYNTPVLTNTTSNIVTDTVTGIKQLSGDLWMEVFPNPATSYVYVKTSAAATGSVLEVTDVTGRLLQRLEITNSTMQLNTSTFADGCYFVKLVSDSGVGAVKKFVVGR